MANPLVHSEHFKPQSDRLKYLREAIIVWFLRALAYMSIVITAGISLTLIFESLGFFTEVSPIAFLTGTKWTPLFDPRSFGVLPIVWGTCLVAAGSAFISVPLGLAIALYLSEYATPRFRSIAKPILELLAGIPSVVFGYFALTTITPILQILIPSTQIFNALSASIVVGVMTLPMVASLSDDAFRAVPQSMRESAYALGATKYEVLVNILIPCASSGIIASAILAFSRAIGETMAVTLAAGATPNLTVNPLESIQTMTAYIVQVSLGDTPHGTIEYQSIFAVGLVLFCMTLIMNILSGYVMNRLRSRFS